MFFLFWTTVLIGVLIIAVIAFPNLRINIISRPLMMLFRRMMPPLSKTEKEALESGTVWWEGELFSGNPDWNKMLNIPKQELTGEEKDFIDGPVDKLCDMLDDWKITSELNDLPQEVWSFLKEQKFFGMIIPKEYGGLGFSAYAHSSVIMKIASRSITAAVTVMVPNSLGPAELLLHYGTDEQKNYYLPRLSRGEDIPCFALTEPEAGSDAGSMKALGTVCVQNLAGKDTLGIRLDWEKRYITLGPVATVLGLAFKLHDPDNLLGKGKNLGITIALIPTDTKGVEIGARHNALNTPFLVGPNYGKDVFIPMDWVIGGQERIGQGWMMLMSCLGVGRSVSLPALSTGSSKLASRTVGAYARVRRQFKLSVGRFEGIKEVLAQIAGNTYVIDSARIMTTAALAAGAKPSVASAIVKYHLTERARKVVNHAMDVFGGAGICMGPRNIIGRTYESLPIGITVEGANILTRSMIIFGQGAVRCHPFIKEEMKAISNPDKIQGLKDFDKAVFNHVTFVLKNAGRSLFRGLTMARFVKTPTASSDIRRYYQNLSRMSSAFVFVSDIALGILGGKLKRMEGLSARLSDVLSELYLASSVLKHFHDYENEGSEVLVSWACQNSLYNIQESLYGFLRNFPNRLIALGLRLIIFPTGRVFIPPSDKLNFAVADILLEPSSLRDHLTDGIYISSLPNDPVGKLENALYKAIASEPLEKRISKTVRNKIMQPHTSDEELLKQALRAGIISEREIETIFASNEARSEVIKVDAF